MPSNFFIFGNTLTSERLVWLADTLKFFFISLHPDALRHPSREKEPFFIFFLTGDALYSLHDEELLSLWNIILSLPSVWLVCNRDELNLRGLSISSLRVKYQNIVFDKGSRHEKDSIAFWDEVVDRCRQLEPQSANLGYLQLSSPFMNRSCINSLDFLLSATDKGMAPEFYAYLDGVHVCHTNQKPVDFRNIGEELIRIYENARKQNLQSLFLVCSQSSAARGYNTWDDGKGVIISTCLSDPWRIRNLNALVDRFRSSHCIGGESAGAIDISQFIGSDHGSWVKREYAPPPLVIILPHSPYGMEYTYGGLLFAVACSHQGIHTRVIFIEDGIYSLTGVQIAEPDDQFFTIQNIIDVAAANDNLEFYGYQPSFSKRSVQKNRKLNAVLDIGTSELAQLLFSPPKGISVNHQRILFF